VKFWIIQGVVYLLKTFFVTGRLFGGRHHVCNRAKHASTGKHPGEPGHEHNDKYSEGFLHFDSRANTCSTDKNAK